MLITQFQWFLPIWINLILCHPLNGRSPIGLLISQNTFSTVLTSVGIVALAGIVVNNNIVLIDTYNFIRSEIHKLVHQMPSSMPQEKDLGRSC